MYIRNEYPEQKIQRRQVARFLSEQEVHQLYLQKKKKKSSKSIVTNKRVLQIDLVDMQTYAPSNNNYKFILMCIDTTSRYLWAYSLLNKTASAVLTFVEPLLRQNSFKILSTEVTNLIYKHHLV
jgi:hypothetical protein